MLDSSLLKRLEMSLLLGTVWHSHSFKPQLDTLSWKSTVAHRTRSVCVESRAGLCPDHTHIRVNTHISPAHTHARLRMGHVQKISPFYELTRQTYSRLMETHFGVYQIDFDKDVFISRN